MKDSLASALKAGKVSNFPNRITQRNMEEKSLFTIECNLPVKIQHSSAFKGSPSTFVAADFLFLIIAGQTCEIDINECVKTPCLNGAICQNSIGSYKCNCKSGYTGRNCETDIDNCKPSKFISYSV